MERDEFGRLQKGHSGLKPKGATHKTTRYTRELISELLACELEQVHTLLEKVTPAERLEFILKLIPYVIPKPAAPEVQEISEVLQGIPLIKFIEP